MKRNRGLSTLGIHPLLIPLALFAMLAGCDGDRPSPLSPTPSPPAQQTLVARFSATPTADTTLGATPTVTVAHDTRPVSGPVRSVRMQEPLDLAVGADGRVRLPFPPDAAALLGERVALELTWRGEETWHPLPPRSGEFAVDEAGRPFIATRLPEQAGRTLELYAKAHGPLPGGVEHVWLPETPVPAAARLEVALGVLRLGDDEQPFEYEVEACVAGDDPGAEAPACEPLASGHAPGPGAPGWLDLQLPLDRFAGQRVAFRLGVRSEAAGADGDAPGGAGRSEADGDAPGLAVPVWSEASVWAPEPDAQPRRNVVLVSLDTLRADHLPFYGYPVDTAPFLDEAFAQRGTLFEHPVAAAASTASSHMSMFTGLDALVHQVANMYRELPHEHPTLAERLRDAGYETGAVTENGALLLSQGFGRGFASYYENKEGDVSSFEGQADGTLARAEDWLRLHRDQPFFLFVHTYQVHYPYTPPPGYEALIPELPEAVAPPGDIPPERHPVLYDREIRYLDDLLRDFFARIAELDLDRDTLFVITSDHGDEFYEHGYLDHGATVFGSATHVPLLLRGPDIPAGLRIATPVGHVDLQPTILELLGVGPTPGIAGLSLVPLIEGRGESAGALGARLLYSETRVRWARSQDVDGGLVRIPTPTISVREGDKKAIRDLTDDGPRIRFYDLARDPDEQAPMPTPGDETFSRLEFRVKLYPFDHKRIAAERTAGSAASAEDDDESLGRVPDYEDELRALGYIE